MNQCCWWFWPIYSSGWGYSPKVNFLTAWINTYIGSTSYKKAVTGKKKKILWRQWDYRDQSSLVKSSIFNTLSKMFSESKTCTSKGHLSSVLYMISKSPDPSLAPNDQNIVLECWNNSPFKNVSFSVFVPAKANLTQFY